MLELRSHNRRPHLPLRRPSGCEVVQHALDGRPCRWVASNCSSSIPRCQSLAPPTNGHRAFSTIAFTSKQPSLPSPKRIFWPAFRDGISRGVRGIAAFDPVSCILSCSYASQLLACVCERRHYLQATALGMQGTRQPPCNCLAASICLHEHYTRRLKPFFDRFHLHRS